MASYKSFDVPEYQYCYHQEISNYFDRLPKNRPIIVADAVGLRSKEVVIFLIDNGFTIIANLAGGITDWEKDGLPMVINNKQRLTGVVCACLGLGGRRVTDCSIALKKFFTKILTIKIKFFISSPKLKPNKWKYLVLVHGGKGYLHLQKSIG